MALSSKVLCIDKLTDVKASYKNFTTSTISNLILTSNMCVNHKGNNKAHGMAMTTANVNL